MQLAAITSVITHYKSLRGKRRHFLNINKEITNASRQDFVTDSAHVADSDTHLPLFLYVLTTNSTKVIFTPKKYSFVLWFLLVGVNYSPKWVDLLYNCFKIFYSITLAINHSKTSCSAKLKGLRDKLKYIRCIEIQE